MSREPIFREIERERVRQDTKWGEQNHPSVDRVLTDRKGGCDPQRMAEEYEIPTANRAQFRCDLHTARGDLTWTHIAVEEMCEAVEAATLKDQGDKKTREELVQLAAVIVAWIECIDRREPENAPKETILRREGAFVLIEYPDVPGANGGWLRRWEVRA